MAKNLPIPLLGALLVLLSGCAQPPPENAGRASPNAAASADLAIAEAVYFDRRTPSGFYREELPGDAWYTITHVTSAHAGTPGEAYRICTHDRAGAAALAEQAAQVAPVYREPVGERRTALYFEFARAHPAAPQLVQLLRVFDCAYYQPPAPGRAQGRINHRPLSAAVARQVIEYDWWFSAANNFGHALLDETLTVLPSHFDFTLHQAELSLGGGDCDLVDIWQERRRIDIASGDIEPQRVWQRALRTRLDDGVPGLCEGEP